jgi:APA family basic amino acid/polyamine antiporter
LTQNPAGKRPSTESLQLKRSLGLGALVLYGVGDILGAGIYALVGKTAGIVGSACWLSFAIALVVAFLTGLSYAELGSRMPRAAGAAAFCQAAFRKPFLSYLIGFLMMFSGMVSMATVSHAFGGYFRALFPAVPFYAIILVFFSMLGFINFRGIRESSMTNILCTCIEMSGILIVIVAGLRFFGNVDYLEITPLPTVSSAGALFQGGILAFYAFIGFEDIVNVSEEAHEPERNIPKAIIAALCITSVVYILTAIAAVSAVPAGELSSSAAPLLLVVQKSFPWFPREIFTLITFFAVTNTGLLNCIMSSRILYGMSREGLVPAVFGKIHPQTQTPHWAILFVFFAALALALTGQIVVLAQSGSLLLLSIFVATNVSLLKLKSQKLPEPPFRVPAVIPLLGAISCLTLIAFVPQTAFKTVGGLILTGGILFLLQTVAQKRSGRFFASGNPSR